MTRAMPAPACRRCGPRPPSIVPRAWSVWRSRMSTRSQGWMLRALPVQRETSRISCSASSGIRSGRNWRICLRPFRNEIWLPTVGASGIVTRLAYSGPWRSLCCPPGMRFKENVQLDPSQVEDERGRGSGFGGAAPGGFRIPVAVGGGGGGLLLVLLFVAFQLLGGNLGTTGGSYTDRSVDSYRGIEVSGGEVAQQCRTGADANARMDCRIV